MVLAAPRLTAEGIEVSGTAVIERKAKAAAKKADSSGVVVSLHPLSGAVRPAAARMQKILQKEKRFEPHVLAVSVGSSVAFPNLDPFFHNVFSMFDGKRFDLGLYEAGATRSTAFTKPGVCYIFCNIHAEMSAVVAVFDTPYFAVTKPNGAFTIPGVEPGRYRVEVWHERGKPEGFPLEVTVGAQNLALGEIRVHDTGQLNVQHKNKYGKDYDTSAGGVHYPH
ncbi:MAG: hypothetical protein U0Q16_17140 [Bryobacteraceae bacterium]